MTFNGNDIDYIMDLTKEAELNDTLDLLGSIKLAVMKEKPEKVIAMLDVVIDSYKKRVDLVHERIKHERIR